MNKRIAALDPRKVPISHGYFVLVRERKDGGFEAALYTRSHETIQFGLCKDQAELDEFIKLSHFAVESVY